jgi:hypothetical protein
MYVHSIEKSRDRRDEFCCFVKKISECIYYSIFVLKNGRDFKGHPYDDMIPYHPPSAESSSLLIAKNTLELFSVYIGDIGLILP